MTTNHGPLILFGSGETARQGRQVFRPNWFCAPGSPDPNGNPPFGGGLGFRCQEKGGPGVWWINRYPYNATQPPGGSPMLAFEGFDVAQVPTMTEWAIFALIGVLGLGGVWMLRRRTTPIAA